MEPFVLDASLTLSWCFEDETNEYSRGILARLRTTYALVPALWAFEIANALAIAERHKRVTPEGAAGFLQILRRLPIQVERREAIWLCESIVSLARELRINAYDASYLELAKLEGMSFASLDHNQREAGRLLGVSLLEVP